MKSSLIISAYIKYASSENFFIFLFPFFRSLFLKLGHNKIMRGHTLFKKYLKITDLATKYFYTIGKWFL